MTAMTPPAPGAAEPPGARPPTAPAPREFREIPELATIHFDFDRHEIRPDAARTLDTNLEWIRSNPDALLLIEGHCDERGTNEYNLALGERRARSTRDYLTARGVQGQRITIISYGEERPVCAERTEDCWARNRRAQFLTKPR